MRRDRDKDEELDFSIHEDFEDEVEGGFEEGESEFDDLDEAELKSLDMFDAELDENPEAGSTALLNAIMNTAEDSDNSDADEDISEDDGVQEEDSSEE